MTSYKEKLTELFSSKGDKEASLASKEDGFSRVFITGDLHGDIDITKLNTKSFPEQKELTKNDYLIITGDFGLIWNDEPSKIEKNWSEWLTTRTYTTIVVLGNHENYNRIEKLPEVEMFGGTVWKYTDSIFILKRGAVYEIAGKKYFTIGGAMSTDQQFRTEGQSWWKQEIPSSEEFDNGLKTLHKHEYEVDYVLTHTAPARVIQQYMNSCTDTYINEIKSQMKEGEVVDEGILYDRVVDNFIDKEYFEERKDEVARYLDVVAYGITPLTFKRWFFGHFHDNWTSKDGKYTLLYKNIVELEHNDG